jgi:hypothetical protein
MIISVVLKQADAEEVALEECMVVMKPCDPNVNQDECIDEEVLL